MTAIARPLRPTLLVAPRSIATGLVGAAALLGVYLGIISLAQGAEHALEQLATDAPFVGLIAAGFGSRSPCSPSFVRSTAGTVRQRL